MGSKRLPAQGRPQRDEASRLGELREAKQENRRLKRQIARLQKQIIKLLEQRGQMEAEASPPPEETVPTCPECDSANLKVVQMGPKSVLVCSDCKWRKTQK